MRNKIIFSLIVMSISGWALASTPVANIKVTGSITPPTCKINGQDDVNLEYKFDIDRGILNDSGTTELDSAINNIEVICDATTYLGFTAIDHRQDSSLYPGASTLYHGLGFFDTDKKIGFYLMIMKNATVKQDTSSVSESVNIANLGISQKSMPLANNGRYVFGNSWTSLKSGKVFNADIEVKPTISSQFKSSWSDESLDGYATLAFSFSL
ncbi:fimbrial protein [Providencia alcalifaciens]|uniref:fimbrial protein n=1 Tax=Providencia sp. wls1921 TaxID=2675153 RepID=UPI0012B552D9|nr:fimbrial protein [Providencia sp. wls1921]MTC42409.1 fimbrial protein [Providencia sp. wls1921]HEQ1858328.1 fimbrial protein [Providencia alcalifaciens]